MKEFLPDNHVRITYDPEAKAVYIKLHCDKNFISIAPWTETLQDVEQGPLINVDRINDIVIGIEIVT